MEGETREELLDGKQALRACCSKIHQLFKDLLALLSFPGLQVILALARDAYGFGGCIRI